MSQSTSLDIIVGPISQLIQRGIPFRFGIVPMLGEEGDICKLLAMLELTKATQMARLFLYTTKVFGRGRTKELLQNVSSLVAVV
jgi:UDP-glucose:glycoprotein glucosyltransferase